VVTSALAKQRQRAEAVARSLVSRLPRGAVVAVFAGGSLGRGEVWAAHVDGCLEIYSDVDLYVVVDGAEACEAARRAVQAAQAESIAPGDAVFLRAVEVGVYTRSDLLAQPVRPGTVDLARHHLLLHGDASVLRELGSAMERPIDEREALYLLENRATELSYGGAGDEARARRLEAVAALKGRLDVAAAHLWADGRFSPRAEERESRFAARAPSSLSVEAVAAVSASFAAARRLEDYLRGADARAETALSLRLIAESWLPLAARLLGGRPETPWALASRRCREGRRIANGREVVRLRHRAGWSMSTALRRGVVLSRFSPRTVLRMHALVVEWQRRHPDWGREFSAHGRYADQLSRALGFDRGPLDERVWAAHRAIN
jgi:hypothetical protein